MSAIHKASFLAVLLSTSQVLATEVVILGGGKTEKEAEAAERSFAAAMPAFGAGFPKRVRSEDVPGLKPGFQVVIAGFCRDRTAAQRAAKALNGIAKGVYTRTVEGTHADRCPSAAIAADPDGAPFLTRIAAAPRSVEVRYAYAANLYERGLLDEAEAQLKGALKVDAEHAPSLTLLRTIAVLKMD